MNAKERTMFRLLCRWQILGFLSLGLFACGDPGDEAPADRAVSATPISVTRSAFSLNGSWTFQRDGALGVLSKKTVQVPSTFESHEGFDFDGVGIYDKRVIAPELASSVLLEGKRALLHFQAAATEAKVSFNGVTVGTHLGGWTPFRFDVTHGIKSQPAYQDLHVVLDEKVGHYTQGFLPIIAPHFGGLWQEVTILLVPQTYIDDLRLKAIGDPDTRSLALEIPIAGDTSFTLSEIVVRVRKRGSSAWIESRLSGAQLTREGDTLKASLPVPDAQLWSPSAPNLYDVEIQIPSRSGKVGDVVSTRAAFRKVEIVGKEVRLNGAPLNIRGLLNWGYYPPSNAPTLDEAKMRSDFVLAKADGFNLMKYCLWVPPKRQLEIADEIGMLGWEEYPTWHAPFTPQNQDVLKREFTEFYCRDRNHPSLIVRSLTCEAGENIDVGVLQTLYDLAHQMIPRTLVEDNSSWPQWNKVSDFFDSHPYGNNDTWASTLRDIDRSYGTKPLILGEAIAADTWVDKEPLASRVGSSRPFWLPGFYDANQSWAQGLARGDAHPAVDQLGADSLRYAMLMRKFQSEIYRREIPSGGYVVAVIRDFDLAAMGLLDYLDQEKWSASDWSWNRDTLCILSTDSDRRSFVAGGRMKGKIQISHFGPAALSGARLHVALEGTSFAVDQSNIQQAPGTLGPGVDFDLTIPAISQPVRLTLRATLQTSQGTFENAWPLWIVPKPDDLDGIYYHPSIQGSQATAIFPKARPIGPGPLSGVVLTSKLDSGIASFIEGGGKVLFLPDGGSQSFPTKALWFLEGGPYVSNHPVTQSVPRDLLVELQHFDLSSKVIPEMPYLDQVDPILLLWANHNLKNVVTRGAIFESRAGQGRFLVSAVDHFRSTNAAGQWLLSVLARHLQSGPAPTHVLSSSTWTSFKAGTF
jgi:hypothetical protein